MKFFVRFELYPTSGRLNRSWVVRGAEDAPKGWDLGWGRSFVGPFSTEEEAEEARFTLMCEKI